MKKLLLLSSALLVVTASAASAQINLSWNNCIGVGTHSMNKNYACDGSANGSPHKAVMSWKEPIGMPELVGIQAVVDIQTSDPILPDFWRRGLGECAEGNVIFPGSLSGLGNATCVNVWAGDNTGGGYDYTTGFGGPARARLRIVFAKTFPSATVYGTHYLGGSIELDTFKDVDSGFGVCNGCLVPACLVLNQMELYQVAGQTPPQQDVYAMSNADQRNWVTWQGGDPSCVGATPTKNRTWGSVKSLYR